MTPPVKFKFKVGDIVRIVAHRATFQKGYEGGWTEELFKVHQRLQRGAYKIADLDHEVLAGSFYEQELQKVEHPSDQFIVEKVLRQRRRSNGQVEYFVKWRGYPNKFNSWTTDIQEYGRQTV